MQLSEQNTQHYKEHYDTLYARVNIDSILQKLQHLEDFLEDAITTENGDMEGTPVAILEANAASLPVISTYHAGIPDVIIHGKTGLLCEEHDVETMSKYMLQLLNDVSYAKTLGSKGKIRIQEHYSLKRHLSKLEDILSSVVT